MRAAAALIVRHIMGSVIVFPHYFEEGLTPFESRLDKGYSMTDCVSMSIMHKLDVTEVPTHDHHFAQEGFIALL
jgi:predicted nucleic acid-binding protein